MNIRPGQRLYSAVSAAEVVVVRCGEGSVQVTCGGVPMLTEPPAEPPAQDDAGDEARVLIGKRYQDPDATTELLCVKAGAGSLAVDGTPTQEKQAKALPSSD